MYIKVRYRLCEMISLIASNYARLYIVRFEPFGRGVAVSSGTTLLDAAQRAGIGLPTACCSQGDCCQCGIRIVDGMVSGFTDLEESCIAAGILPEDRRLACCTRILSAVKVLIPEDSGFRT